MRLNTFLLSSAALMASATVGLAADLPSKKAAPVDYVRVCTIGTFTGFVIPGSDTCLKIGGFVRWQGTYNEPRWTKPGNGRNNDVFTQGATASIKFDARTTTEYGLLRSFADFRMNQGGTSGVDKAYIQFAGLHAGKVQSLFDFYADDASYGSAGLGSDHSAVAIGYTASFGSGFYGVVSLEVPQRVAGPSVTTGGTTYTTGYAGQRVPDLVAALGVEQSWGKAQLSGVVHQINTPNPGSYGNSDSTYGYAIQGGVKINVPALGASDALFLQAAYADGAVTYLGSPSTSSGSLGGATFSSGYDFAYDKNGAVKKTKGYNILAAYEHAWSPTLFSNVFGGYTVFDPSKTMSSNTSYIAYTGGAAPGQSFEARKAAVTQVGANVTWKPVKGFLLAAEVTYFDVKLDKKVTVNNVGKSSDNVWQGVVRLQRDF